MFFFTNEWLISVVNRFILSIIFLSITVCQEIDEIELLLEYKKESVSEPDYLHKDNGLWYNKNLDVPYTGRLKVYNKTGDIKLAECTFVNGLKNGIMVQYYNEKEMLDGIIGLYVNNKREGNWIWLQPDKDWQNQIKKNLNHQILTSIDFRDGIKFGDTQIHKVNIQLYGDLNRIPYEDDSMILRGQYANGLEIGDWYYYDDLYSDFDLAVQPSDLYDLGSYWTRKQTFESGKLVHTDCREPYKEVDCDYFELNYGSRKFNFISSEQYDVYNDENNKLENKYFLQDDNGVSVEININAFMAHINQFHYSIGSVHKERGYTFTIDQNLKNKLYAMINNYK